MSYWRRGGWAACECSSVYVFECVRAMSTAICVHVRVRVWERVINLVTNSDNIYIFINIKHYYCFLPVSLILQILTFSTYPVFIVTILMLCSFESWIHCLLSGLLTFPALISSVWTGRREWSPVFRIRFRDWGQCMCVCMCVHSQRCVFLSVCVHIWYMFVYVCVCACVYVRSFSGQAFLAEASESKAHDRMSGCVSMARQPTSQPASGARPSGCLPACRQCCFRTAENIPGPQGGKERGKEEEREGDCTTALHRSISISQIQYWHPRSQHSCFFFSSFFPSFTVQHF